MNKTLRISLLFCLFLLLQLGAGLKAISVNVTTPGTLSTLVTDLSITDLTITGTIDARDFKFIRDKIPDLAILDLTTVIVAGYTGKGGTAGESSFSYPPNAIPSAAFFNALSGVGKDSFTSILLPTSIYTIDDHAFDNCVNITGTLVIPANVTNIGVGAFNQCSSITGLIIPNTALTIEDNAFFDCTLLTGTLIIPESVAHIGTNAFSRVACDFVVDHGNMFYASRDGVLFDNDSTTLIQCPTSKKGNYLMPKEVEFIGSAAFADCVNLDGVLHIGENVKSIGEDAFSGCTGYSGLLTFPPFVQTLGAGCFASCSGFDSLLIPSSIDNIGSDAFADCSGLTGKLVIPTSVTTIGEGAFVGCGSLSGTLVIPPTVTSIEPNTFKDCTDFTGTLKIPEGVQDVGANAFRECHGFTSLTLPSTVNAIGANAFYNCHNLKTLVAEMDAPPSLGANTKVFYNVNKDSCTLYVPAGKKALYASLPQWKDFKHIIEGHDFWLSTTDVFLAKQAGSTATASVTVTSNTIWTPTSPDAWLTVSPSVATSGNGVLTFVALTTNPLITTRISNVVVSAPGAPNQTITVTQAAGDPHLEISGQTATLGKEVMAKEKDGAAFITVSSNTTWTVVCDQPWITPSPLTASNDGVLILTANSSNTTGAPRTATVTVSAPGVASKTITVSQTDVPSYFTIPTLTATVTKEIGSTATIPITSNTTWIASSDQSWLTVGPTTASLGNGNLTVTTSGFNPTEKQIGGW